MKSDLVSVHNQQEYVSTIVFFRPRAAQRSISSQTRRSHPSRGAAPESGLSESVQQDQCYYYYYYSRDKTTQHDS
jgi:hypothetical protein